MIPGPSLPPAEFPRAAIPTQPRTKLLYHSPFHKNRPFTVRLAGHGAFQVPALGEVAEHFGVGGENYLNHLQDSLQR